MEQRDLWSSEEDGTRTSEEETSSPLPSCDPLTTGLASSCPSSPFSGDTPENGGGSPDGAGSGTEATLKSSQRQSNFSSSTLPRKSKRRANKLDVAEMTPGHPEEVKNETKKRVRRKLLTRTEETPLSPPSQLMSGGAIQVPSTSTLSSCETSSPGDLIGTEIIRETTGATLSCSPSTLPSIDAVAIDPIRKPVEAIQAVCWLPESIAIDLTCREPEEIALAREQLAAYPIWWGRGEDQTAIKERLQVWRRLSGIPMTKEDYWVLGQVLAWREKYQAGTLPEPVWDQWCEWSIILSSGQPCIVLNRAMASRYADVALEFTGQFSPTGFQAWFAAGSLRPKPEEPLRDYSKRIAEVLLLGWQEEEKQKTKTKRTKK